MKFTLFLYFHLVCFYPVCQSNKNIRLSKGLWDNLGKSSFENNKQKNDNTNSYFQQRITQNTKKDLLIDNLQSKANINIFDDWNSPISDSSNDNYLAAADSLPFETKLDQHYRFLSDNRTNSTNFWKQDHIDLLEHGKKPSQIIYSYPATNNYQRKNGYNEVYKIEKHNNNRQLEVPQIENGQQEFGESSISEVLRIHK